MAAKYGTIRPVYQVTFEGSTALIICTSKSNAHWTKDDNALPSRLQVNNNLMLQSVSHSDMGLYACHGTYENDETFIADSKLLVGGTLNPHTEISV